MACVLSGFDALEVAVLFGLHPGGLWLLYRTNREVKQILEYGLWREIGYGGGWADVVLI